MRPPHKLSGGRHIIKWRPPDKLSGGRHIISGGHRIKYFPYLAPSGFRRNMLWRGIQLIASNKFPFTPFNVDISLTMFAQKQWVFMQKLQLCNVCNNVCLKVRTNVLHTDVSFFHWRSIRCFKSTVVEHHAFFNFLIKCKSEILTDNCDKLLR